MTREFDAQMVAALVGFWIARGRPVLIEAVLVLTDLTEDAVRQQFVAIAEAIPAKRNGRVALYPDGDELSEDPPERYGHWASAKRAARAGFTLARRGWLTTDTIREVTGLSAPAAVHLAHKLEYALPVYRKERQNKKRGGKRYQWYVSRRSTEMG